MILDSVLRIVGCTQEHLETYLSKCDDVFELPNGYAVRKGTTMHLIAPQKALSGRRLIRECKEILNRVHERIPVVYAPVAHENIVAKKLVAKLGFAVHSLNKTHVWFCHGGKKCEA